MRKSKTMVREKFCTASWLLKPGMNKVELPMHNIIVEEGFLLNKRLPRKTLIVRAVDFAGRKYKRKQYRVFLSKDIKFLGTQKYHLVFPQELIIEDFESFFFKIENTHPSKTFKIGYAVKGREVKK